jgi:hypothetical protein
MPVLRRRGLWQPPDAAQGQARTAPFAALDGST